MSAPSREERLISVGRLVPTAMKGTWFYGLARRNKPEVKRFVKFAIVGGIGLIIDVALLNIFERSLGMSVPLAVALAFIIAATHNFIGNRLWVYPESRKHKKRWQMPVFLAVNAMGLLISELIFLFFQMPITELMRLVPLATFQTHYRGIGLNATKMVAAVVVMLWNFFVNRFITFRDVKWQTTMDG